MTRWPAEWEPHSAVLIAWPHPDTDWGARLPQSESAYRVFAQALARFEPVWVLVRDEVHERHVRRHLTGGAFRFLRVAYDDTWTRDYGPVTVLHGNAARLLDFRFDGWGGKYDARRDDTVTRRLHARRLFGDTPLESIGFVLEGGAVDTDGAGTVLTTAEFWRARHPGLTPSGVEGQLRRHLGTKRLLRLDYGRLSGDDTDAHVDTLARFCGPGAIAWQSCDDPGDVHHERLRAMGEQLASFRTAAGAPYDLTPLPWPGVVEDTHGRRLPAGYANFLIVNGGVLVPAFGIRQDEEARTRLQAVFPRHRVISVPGSDLIWQNGGLHCAAMQLPAAVPVQACPERN